MYTDWCKIWFKTTVTWARQECFLSVQAMERREEAVQEVEEARLALRAAQRDNADLQARLQQQALPPRPGHSHTRPATARQLWAAPRDRPYASATASPHSKYACQGCDAIST